MPRADGPVRMRPALGLAMEPAIPRAAARQPAAPQGVAEQSAA
ncbi:hypothetical protein [Pseudoduganella umbonata]|uniref:Uncharacterized protein n=1 Tax=Pseudoduganella umbonata TaxID=864828 RepID=A0A7W5E949_9BURK|nr:hypothetical protein [Pseudoduganella umbonata]MBB3220964.1 hypothetical protein [Pseudoduganella umbonata]